MRRDDVLGDLMRGSLDHCVKCTICETFCPVSNVTPLFPGPKYVGPQAERFRVARRGVAGRVARLLLGLRHLHAGVPAGRAHRRDQHAGARQAARADGLQAARPAARAAGRDRAAGTPAAPVVNWTLRNRLAAGCSASGWSGSTARAALPAYPGPDVPALGAEAHVAAGRAPRRLLPRLRRQLVRAADSGEMTVELLEHLGCQVEVPRGQACCGLPAQSNGHVRPRPPLRAPDGASGSRRRRGRASTSSARRRAAR